MESQKPVSDEIDLGQLFEKIGKFFYNGWINFMRFLALLRRIPRGNKWIFIIVILSTVVGGIGYSSFLEKKYYESTMILSSDYLNKRLVDNSIEKLNLLADEKNKHGLAKLLDISDALAAAILKFEAKPFVAENDLIELEVLKEQLKNAQANAKNEKVIEQVVQRIEIENRHAFEITVQTLSPTTIGELQTALVSYFRNNDYVKNRIAVTKSNLVEKQTKLKSDLRKLDSLKSVIYDNYKNMASQARQGSNNVVFSDKTVTDPIEIYKQDVDVYNQLQYVNEALYLHRDFEVVDGFTEFSEPATPSLVKEIVISMLLGFVLSYLAVALIGFDRYLSKLN